MTEEEIKAMVPGSEFSIKCTVNKTCDGYVLANIGGHAYSFGMLMLETDDCKLISHPPKPISDGDVVVANDKFCGEGLWNVRKAHGEHAWIERRGASAITPGIVLLAHKLRHATPAEIAAGKRLPGEG